MNKNIFQNQSGVSLVAVVIITGIVVFGGYAIYMFTSSDVPEDGAMIEKSPSPTPDSMMKDDKMMEDKNGAMMELKFSGQVLAGTKSPLLDFNKIDYDKAITSDKLVILYFYANWCPICKAEFPKMQEAFNELTTDEVIGFRVNYNDDQTDSYEEALARQYGVAYQHTKVFIRNGQRILKSPESWDEKRYDIEISKALE